MSEGPPPPAELPPDDVLDRELVSEAGRISAIRDLARASEALAQYAHANQVATEADTRARRRTTRWLRAAVLLGMVLLVAVLAVGLDNRDLLGRFNSVTSPEAQAQQLRTTLGLIDELDCRTREAIAGEPPHPGALCIARHPEWAGTVPLLSPPTTRR